MFCDLKYMKPKRICYQSEKGVLSFRYDEKVVCGDKYHPNAFRCYSTEGVVPAEIVSLGKDAVEEYVKGEVEKKIGKEKERDKELDRIRMNARADIALTYDGKELVGSIAWSSDERHHVVRMESPFRGQKTLFYAEGFGAAMAGLRFWESPGVFSKGALERARRDLIEVYNDHKYHAVVSLAKELNGK